MDPMTKAALPAMVSDAAFETADIARMIDDLTLLCGPPLHRIWSVICEDFQWAEVAPGLRTWKLKLA